MEDINSVTSGESSEREDTNEMNLSTCADPDQSRETSFTQQPQPIRSLQSTATQCEIITSSSPVTHHPSSECIHQLLKLLDNELIAGSKKAGIDITSVLLHAQQKVIAQLLTQPLGDGITHCCPKASDSCTPNSDTKLSKDFAGNRESESDGLIFDLSKGVKREPDVQLARANPLELFNLDRQVPLQRDQQIPFANGRAGIFKQNLKNESWNLNQDESSRASFLSSASPPEQEGWSRAHQEQLEEMHQFAREFKEKRIRLGYTQSDVGHSLGSVFGSDFSQTTISRFEALNLSFRNMIKLKPTLQLWIENVHRENRRIQPSSDPEQKPQDANPFMVPRKRKKRSCIDSNCRETLEQLFDQNNHPTPDEIVKYSEALNMEPETIRIWFSNRRQKQKRLASPQIDENGHISQMASLASLGGQSINLNYRRMPSPRQDSLLDIRSVQPVDIEADTARQDSFLVHTSRDG